ncbi:MAG TPA: hypothetical protein VGK88_12775 [bacterium]
MPRQFLGMYRMRPREICYGARPVGVAMRWMMWIAVLVAAGWGASHLLSQFLANYPRPTL